MIISILIIIIIGQRLQSTHAKTTTHLGHARGLIVHWKSIQKICNRRNRASLHKKNTWAKVNDIFFFYLLNHYLTIKFT